VRRKLSWRLALRRQTRQWRAERGSVFVSGGLMAGLLGLSFVLRALGFGVR